MVLFHLKVKVFWDLLIEPLLPQVPTHSHLIVPAQSTCSGHRKLILNKTPRTFSRALSLFSKENYYSSHRAFSFVIQSGPTLSLTFLRLTSSWCFYTNFLRCFLSCLFLTYRSQSFSLYLLPCTRYITQYLPNTLSLFAYLSLCKPGFLQVCFSLPLSLF